MIHKDSSDSAKHRLLLLNLAHLHGEKRATHYMFSAITVAALQYKELGKYYRFMANNPCVTMAWNSVFSFSRFLEALEKHSMFQCLS